jgi:hypothetical protein
MPKATDPAITRDDTDFQDSDATVDEGSARTPVVGLTARLAGLELDAGTLEMVMAALTADVCDQIETGTS